MNEDTLTQPPLRVIANSPTLLYKDRMKSNEPISVEKALAYPYKWHDEFEKNNWQEYAKKQGWGSDIPSFHNKRHLESVERANDAYLDNFTSKDDPLNVLDGLKEWNREHPDMIFDTEDLSDFRDAMKWTIRCHDLGNIMLDIQIDQSNDINPIFRDKFTRNRAEEVSIVIAHKLIDASDVGRKKRLKAFTAHMIDGTIYSDQPKTDTLQNYMEVMDQIGNEFFSDDDTLVAGLVFELTAEDRDFKMNQAAFMNFSRSRLSSLIPDKGNQEVLINRVWQKDLPPINVAVGEMTGKEFVVDYIKKRR